MSYYESKFEGTITDSIMLEDFRAFFASSDWVPEHNELADLSEADLSNVTPDGIKGLASFIKLTFQSKGISPKVAVFAPNDLPFGLARMYSVPAEDFETHMVFRDLNEAKLWLHTSPDSN
jgi:hypothetical protein